VPDSQSLHQWGRLSTPSPAIVHRSNTELHYRFLIGLNPTRQSGIILGWALVRTVGRPARKPAVAMTQEEERDLREQLARLQEEHRDLDAAIAALQDAAGSDLLQIQRLKKRKLYLRDRISFIDDQLTPDIIA
jgi:hypothetical protein